MSIGYSIWQRYIDYLPSDSPLRPIQLGSCMPGGSAQHRVDDEELEQRRAAAAATIDVAKAHVLWLSAALSGISHAVCVADGDGVVVFSTGDQSLQEDLQMLPGCNRSDDAMGPSAAETAMSGNQTVVAVTRNEPVSMCDYRTSIAVPLREREGHVIGALEVGMGPAHARPDILVFISYTARMIARDLAYRVRERDHEAYDHLADQLRVRQKEIREATARLSVVIDNTPELCYFVDAAHHVLQVNRSFRQCFGLPADTVVEKSLREILPSGIAEAFIASNEKALQQGETLRFEETIVCGGTTRRFSSVRIPLRDDNGDTYGVCALCTDVTERALAAEKARQSVQRLERLVDMAIVLDSLHDLDRVLDIVTESARTVVGSYVALTRLARDHDEWGEFIEATSVSAEHGESGTDVMEEGLRSLVYRVNKPVRLTSRDLSARRAGADADRHKQNGEAPHELLAVPLMSRDQKSLGLIQLTHKREGEFTEEDEAVLAQLARMGALAIENVMAHEAREQSIASKDQLVALLAKELSNPVAAIRKAASVLQHQAADEKARLWAVEFIDRQVSQTAGLVDDLADVMRITGGDISLEKRPLPVFQVIGNVLETCKALIVAKRQRATITGGGRGVHVAADARRIEQAFGNLLTHASKAAPEESTIDFNIDRHEDQAVICIRHAGAGLPIDTFAFRPLAQGEEAWHSGQGALRVELWLAKSLLELHGGSVSVLTSGTGTGGEYVITLPLAEPGDEANESAGQNASPVTAPAS